MSFPGYPTYVESGAEWLDDVPDHWTVKRLKALLREIDIRAGDTPFELLGLSKTQGVVLRSNLSQGASTSDNYDRYKVVRPGNIVMNKMQAWNGVFGLSAYAGMISPDYAVFEVEDKCLGHFLTALLRTDQAAGELFTRCRGMGTAFLRLNTGDLFDVRVPLPPPSELEGIIRFLDLETAKIDALIEEQQRLIALLDEKRQASISHAVTKGLDPQVPMKDSGIEWLGGMPAHWEVVPLRRLTREHRQGYYSSEGYVDDGIPLVRITDISDDHSLSISESPRVSNNSSLSEFLLIDGDFLFARTGGAGSFGVVKNLREPAAYASYLIRFRFADRVRPDFLTHYFESDGFTRGIENTIHGGVNQNIHAEDIKNQCIALPPQKEQGKIADYLASLTTRYQSLKDEAARAIELMRERRSALISAAITGKIDVRGLVAEQAEAA